MMAKQRTFLKTEDITPNSGAQVQLGPACLGEMRKDAWVMQQTHPHSWITDGTRMQLRS